MGDKSLRPTDSLPSDVAGDPPAEFACLALNRLSGSTLLPLEAQKPLDLDPTPATSSCLKEKDEAALDLERAEVCQPHQAYYGKPLTSGRKRILLFIFSLGISLDVLGFSVFFILVGPVANDLQLDTEQQSWIITAFQVTFASFLLLWGRACDIFSPRPVFVYGFMGFGTCNLIISFLPNPYAFFVFRALSGICGSALVPASYRLITKFFNRDEARFGFTVIGIIASLSNALGLVLGGVFELIPGTGQMTAWRWYFRASATIILIASSAAVFLIPRMPLQEVDQRLRRMDLAGGGMMLAATLLIILGLTLGASYGFVKAGFFAPFLLGLALLVGFFVYQAFGNQEYVLIPRSQWKHKNVLLWTILSLLPYAYFSLNYVPLPEIYTRVHGEKPIIAALRVMPQGAAAATCAIFLIVFPKISNYPRIPYLFCCACMIGSYVLLIYSGDQVGTDYFRYILPGLLIGGAAGHGIFTFGHVGLMTTVPPDQAGVAGALLQVMLQIGAATGISVQAGLWTVHPGSVTNFANVQLSWWLVVGWIALFALLFAVFYRQPDESETAAGGDIAAH